MEEALVIVLGLLVVGVWYAIKYTVIGIFYLVTWPWRARRKKAEKEAQHKQEVEAEERREAKRKQFFKSHSTLLDAIRRTLVLSGSKVTEMMRVCKTMSDDADFGDVTPSVLLQREILSIVAAFASANGHVSQSLAELYSGLLEQIGNGDIDIDDDEHAERVIQNSARNPNVFVPPTVMFLSMYDSTQNTAFAAEAAATYIDLVQTVATMCASAPVAARMVQTQYGELLAPYLAPGNDTSRRSGRTQQASSRIGCGDCASFYERLGLRNGAAETEVKEAHRVLAQALHSDKWGDKSDLARRVADEQMKSINAARDHLLNCRFSKRENVPSPTSHQPHDTSAAGENGKQPPSASPPDNSPTKVKEEFVKPDWHSGPDGDVNANTKEEDKRKQSHPSPSVAKAVFVTLSIVLPIFALGAFLAIRHYGRNQEPISHEPPLSLSSPMRPLTGTPAGSPDAPIAPQDPASVSDSATDALPSVDSTDGVAPSEASSSVDADIRYAVINWKQAFLARDVSALANCYAPQVEQFFRKKNVSRSWIEDSYQESFDKMDNIYAYNISDLHVDLLDGSASALRATATYNKEWDTSQTDGRRFSGDEVERLTFEKLDGGWKIVREEELQIIRVSRQ